MARRCSGSICWLRTRLGLAETDTSAGPEDADARPSDARTDRAIASSAGRAKLIDSLRCRGADNLHERFGYKAGVADERAVDVRLVHQRGGVVRLDASAILNDEVLRRWIAE